MRRMLLALVPALLVALAGPAQAQTTVLDRAAAELRRSSVYVDPAAERAISASEADRLKERIRSGRSPIFVAVLPAAAIGEAGGEARLPEVMATRVGLQGTYAVVAGNSFRAGSDVLPRGRAGELATSSFQAQRDAGTDAVLSTFVDRVNEAARSGAAPSGGSDARDSGGGDSGAGDSGGGMGGGGAVLALLAIGGGGLFLWSRSRRQKQRQEDRREMEADRQLLQAELSVLGSDVLQLEPQVVLHPEAREDYDAGVTRYRSAQAAMDYADDQVDLVRVERVIDEGRYAMDRARARIEGREPPAPPEKLTRPGRHDEPALELDERGMPVYAGYGGGWYGGGGWFGGGGGGGLLTGLMLGGMLGGGWGGWGGHGHGHDGGDQGADEGGGWIGDAGGGDWGGGDFGGGDFGGDVGGGDW